MVPRRTQFLLRWALPVISGMCLFVFCSIVFSSSSYAISTIPAPTPQPGSYGLEATKTQAPPTQAATISVPGNGSSFTTSPITVSGICPTGLLVEVYDNNVLIGSSMCTSGSFTMQASLFSGTNQLSAIDYDNLEQAGPTSNINTVTYNNAQFSAFGQLVTLTSSFGRRSAGAGAQLNWPLQLSGGSGPYAMSIDWGDGSSAELKSQAVGGVVDIAHVYEKAGIYQANVRVTDANNVSAFLQMVAVASGKVDAAIAGSAANGANGSGGNAANGKPITKVVWIPAAIAVVLLLPAFWLGRQSQVVSLRNKILRERDSYKP